MKINLLGFDLNALQEFFISIDEKPFRAVQILKWIHQYKVTDFNLMTNLSKTLREKLIERCEIKTPKIKTEQISSDGTIKWLMEVSNNNCIETVFIPEEKRGTLCISSQVGCVLNCTFCATAMLGFKKNLEISEIIGQLWCAQVRLNELEQEKLEQEKLEQKQLEKKEVQTLNGSLNKVIKKTVNKTINRTTNKTSNKISNLVFMGMGEPLYNFNNVVKSINIMREDNAYGLAKRKVTVSTSGIIPEILKLADITDVSLAVSLHAPNDELRSKLMPINKKFPIKELIQACKTYISKRTSPKAKITFEYLMLKDVNDTVKIARELAKILAGVACKVNLIPFNAFPSSKFHPSPVENVKKFQEIVAKSGIVCTIRKQRGFDISASCGQLAGQKTN